MIRIDDNLLHEIGLGELPEAERKKLLSQIYRMLEERVGMRLAEQMSEQQLNEFEKFVDGDAVYTEDYLNATKPGWQQSEAYLAALKSAAAAAEHSNVQVNEMAVKAEFAALGWLETNFPDYKAVVADELEKLKAEIKRDSQHIAASIGAQPGPQLQAGEQPQPSQAAQTQSVPPSVTTPHPQPTLSTPANLPLPEENNTPQPLPQPNQDQQPDQTQPPHLAA